MSDIFEQPWTLLITAIVVLLVMLIVRRIFPEKRRSWQWLLPCFLGVAAFGLDLLVKTDTEKIKAVIHTAVKAVEKENPDAVEPIISANYRDSYHNTKKALMHHCRTTLSQPLVEKNITRILAIEIPPVETGLLPRRGSGTAGRHGWQPKTTATAIFTVRIVFDKQSYVYQNFRRIMLTKLKLDLQKQPDNRWLINRAELLEIGTQPVKWQDIKQISW
jgi:hypothetical protein